ncbi:Protein CNGC15c [Sarracenia purpurea var. burkii]
MTFRYWRIWSYKRLRYADSEQESIQTTTNGRESTIKFRCNGASLKSEVLSRLFSEDFKTVKMNKKEGKKKKQAAIDPRGDGVRRWRKIFLAACLISLFVDPLFFYLPKVRSDLCLETSASLEAILTSLRSATDLFHFINILVRLRTAYVAPSSSVFGRGDLVLDPWKIAFRYFSAKGFWFDLAAALPIPQVLIWGVMPNLKGSSTSNFKISLMLVMMIQYVQRLGMAYPLSMQFAKSTVIVAQTAWIGAAYNLLLYLLSSHVMGGCLYLLSVEREAACWRSVCDQSNSTCNYGFFDCGSTMRSPGRDGWIQSSNVTNLCNPSNEYYPYGIYGEGVSSGVTNARFFQRFFYSLWVGLKSVGTMGQNFTTSIFIGENIFATIIVMLGVFNLALLIGNMQRYLQSITARLEERRLKKRDKEEWMHHRQLPKELREDVRRYDRYKWVATQGVDQEALLNELPKYLRRQIKRQLCLNLVRRVPLFDEMDDRMLDSICERLKPVLWTAGMFVVREGDPLNEMLFIIRGHLDSYTTNGGRTGFFESNRIRPGDFCGEELLTWALRPRPTSNALPSSTRTVRAICDAEAFALGVADLKFVASQFRWLHGKKLRQKLRFHSHQWRMWAACSIQAAWRRYRKRRELAEIAAMEHGFGPVGGGSRKKMVVGRPPQPGTSFSDSSGGSLKPPAEPDAYEDVD